MDLKPYQMGTWAIYKDRASVDVLGYISNGVGRTTVPDEPPFSIDDESLIAPDGTRLGHLAKLGDSWVVNLGDHDIGHVLRKISA